jgi:alpha-L-arabinofuranosidase
VEAADRRIASVRDCETLAGTDARAVNSFEEPEKVCARSFDGWQVRAGRASAKLPPLSVTASTFRLA